MSQLLSVLREDLGDMLREDEATRAAQRADAWVMAEWAALQGRGGALPLAVLEPTSTEDVARAVRVCRALAVPLVTRGGGSGVCGGVQPGTDHVVLSTRRLDGLVGLESDDLLARFGAGTMGSDAEQCVQQEGLTIGHWPQSIALSTVGGWVATRAAGQFSTAYGNIEDVVLALEAVLPDGSVLRTRETPRASAGPDLRQLFLGSEGTLGVITEVTFSLRPLPETSSGQALHFADFETGLAALRRVLRAGWRPPVVRLYDAREARRSFRDFVPRDRALLLLLHEGPAPAVASEAPAVEALCREGGGVVTDPAAVSQWLAHRNQVPSFRSFLEEGVVVDTIEVAATWSRLPSVYASVVASLGEVPGILAATAHASHAYRSGANLYFSFAAKPSEPQQIPAVYAECWRRTMEATLAAGGGIAHHHGVGRVRRGWLAQELGTTGAGLLLALKDTLDPAGLLNPGVLLPPR
ncbi:FAD-binding oxidoreductase [Myxococcota bacterium]|nr:FAD-binding oxidoreductase [Myxococcota bacterium]MCZ7619387.1 FAD-binding oxidoreductase [Myxococcota bacterium]